MTKYWGGKGKLGKEISKVMLEIIEESPETYQAYWEPFTGMGGVMRHMTIPLLENHNPDIEFYATDLDKGVINFWNFLKMGGSFAPILKYSDRELEHLRETKSEQTPEHTFVGHSCGFHGIYFSGKVIGPDTRKLLGSAYRSTERVREAMQYPSFEHENFFDIAENFTPTNSIIYLDPPYVERQGLDHHVWNHKTNGFDTDAFWNYLEEWSDPELNNLIFVSETWAPEGWNSVWSKNWNNKNSKKNAKRIERQEQLYCNLA